VRKSVCFVVLVLLAAGVAQADSLNVRLVGSCVTPDLAYGLAVVGNYAYVANCGSGLRIIDVSDPQSPFEAGYYDTADYARGVAVSGIYAYVAYGYSGLRVLDVSNPSSPVEVGICATPDYAWGVALSGNYAYVAAEDAGLQVVDISNPSTPVIVGACGTPSSAMSIVVADSHAYVAALGAGLRIIDVSNPASPVEVGFYDITPDLEYGIAVSGNYAYMGNFHSLRVIDVSNPASPVEVGNLYEALAVNSVAVAGSRAYLANGNVTVVDVSNPQAPSEVGYYGDANAFGMAVSGIYAYAASWNCGLRIYEYYGDGVEEMTKPKVEMTNVGPTVVRGVLRLRDCHPVSAEETGGCTRAVLMDANGRKAADLQPGANDVSRLSPGVYFCRLTAGSASCCQASSVTKVVIQ
jgi:hypothetical protein